MDARTVARIYAVGRAGLGAALLVAPSRLGRPWLGAVADEPGGQVALRGLGIRDLVLGGIALHVADRPGVGARTMLTCAIADGVDAGATLAARRHLPSGALGVAVLAGAGAATGFWLRAALPA
ncbi:MAG TPA: hypothetical protein VGO71_10550 [Baekduia sp.]|jgi:hypothetical protein|nr:hypothetical protein [Baekduia sp.]